MELYHHLVTLVRPLGFKTFFFFNQKSIYERINLGCYKFSSLNLTYSLQKFLRYPLIRTCVTQ